MLHFFPLPFPCGGGGDCKRGEKRALEWRGRRREEKQKEEKKGKRDSCGEEEFLPRTKALRFCAISLVFSIFSRVDKAYASKHGGGGGGGGKL